MYSIFLQSCDKMLYGAVHVGKGLHVSLCFGVAAMLVARIRSCIDSLAGQETRVHRRAHTAHEAIFQSMA